MTTFAVSIAARHLKEVDDLVELARQRFVRQELAGMEQVAPDAPKPSVEELRAFYDSKILAADREDYLQLVRAKTRRLLAEAEVVRVMAEEVRTQAREMAGDPRAYVGWWMVTIKPKMPASTTFDAFFALVQKYMGGAAWQEWTLSFEQNGTSEATLGDGFHCHIVGKTSWTKLSQVLRNTVGEPHKTAPTLLTKGTFSKFINDGHMGPPGVKVFQIRSDPADLVQRYLVDYQHDKPREVPKTTYKSWDAAWRAKESLMPLYTHTTGVLRMVQ